MNNLPPPLRDFLFFFAIPYLYFIDNHNGRIKDDDSMKPIYQTVSIISIMTQVTILTILYFIFR